MLGQTGIGTWIAYGLICAFLVLISFMTLRLALMLSLLWILPVVALLRRVPGVRHLLPAQVASPESSDGN